MKFSIIIGYLTFSLLFISTADAQFFGKKKKKEEQSASKKSEKKSEFEKYSEIVKKGTITDDGLFKTHMNNDKLYFEIPFNLLGKDMLLVSRIAKLPDNFGGGYVNAGSKINEQVVRWERRKNNIDIKVVSFENESDEESPIYKSVEANNFFPILFSSKIEAFNSDSTSLLVDVSDIYQKEVASLNAMSSRIRKRYSVKRLDQSRSYIESVNSYPQNIEVKHVMTYDADNPPERDQANTISMLLNQSMILLPEDKMMPRLADYRVGWFTIEKYNYNSDELKSDNYEILRRWRLEPKDVEAYKRGELVEPIKPIVYYLDPATPEKWRPYFKQGIEDWNVAFEKAGFKNAIIAKDAPTKEEDPEFSPEDVRYSVVRYVASTTRNAVGPSVSDPRTGEILESDIIWYHNHLRSYRNRFMIEAGAQNPDARTLQTPEAEIGEMMRMVIAHEVGHALGLPHNMKASSAYPTDSLRSASFTQKYGLTPSIMDYARVNYVAQPEDKGVRYIRMMGPYDEYAINWGYRYLPDAETKEDEKATLDKWILEKADNPWYQFGGGYDGVDPQSQRESLGKDQVKASEYGLANLKKVVPNLVEWTSADGETYAELEEVYRELGYIWRRYVGHVTTNIGGVYETRKTADQEGVLYTPVPKGIQRYALSFLLDHAFTTPNWLLNKDILDRIESNGAIDRVKSIQLYNLNQLLDEDRLIRMVEAEERYGNDAYSVIEFLTNLRKGLFSELYSYKKTDAYRRNIQREYVEIAGNYIHHLEAEDPENGILISDIISLMRGELNRLKNDLTRYGKNNDQLTAYHWDDLSARIDKILAND
ncbi:zinc-dependent metalloprotease [Marivirga atlantica]|uniref:Zinc-dependent metalloprotease n=1 Tax=Marivirga atlantica TaxID=1548457 RepID=A0A937DJA6_9BACT|nr:zinc-dependent metalloprotease [Marivirga atlantica]MBL0765800.1 zinc-dependent metalloprotease [Marivirga atlantica]